MTTDAYAPSAVGERIRELCRQFRLPTLATETVDRFSDAGHADALPTLVEVLEQEAEDRRIRRVDRLRRASKLPAGKTWDTFEHERAPVKLRQQLVRLAEGDFVDRGVNVLAFGLPGTGKTHAMCAIGHRLVQSDAPCCSSPRIAWFRICSRQSETSTYRGCSGSWITTTCWS